MDGALHGNSVYMVLQVFVMQKPEQLVFVSALYPCMTTECASPPLIYSDLAWASTLISA